MERGQLTVARVMYPEDLSVGDHIVLSEVSYQYATFNWCGADMSIRSPEEPIEITYYPSWDKHEPMKVKAVCLPFVLCKTVEKKHCVLDLRQVKVARVDDNFATSVKNAAKSDAKAAKAGSRKSGKRKKAKTKSRKKK